VLQLYQLAFSVAHNVEGAALALLLLWIDEEMCFVSILRPVGGAGLETK